MKKTNKKLKPNKNNFETYLPGFYGFYNSLWDEPDFYGEAEHYGLSDKFPFWDYVKWGEYYEALAKSFCDTIEKAMSKWIERIEYTGIWSPKEYNFVNDKVECIIRPRKKAVQKFIYDNKEDFEQYLVDHHKSRDGFISFHPHDFESWEQTTKKFTDFSDHKSGYIMLGSVLNFIADVENRERDEQIDHMMLYYGADDIYISEFYTDEFYKIVDRTDEIKKFVKDNYMHENVRELALEKFTGEEAEEKYKNLSEEKVKDAINEAINEIEEQTIRMIF